MQTFYIIKSATLPCWEEEVTTHGVALTLQDAIDYCRSHLGAEAISPTNWAGEGFLGDTVWIEEEKMIGGDI